MIEKVVTLMWLYLITVNTQREAGVDGTELSQETVITNCLSILSILSLLNHLLLALCSQVSALSLNLSFQSQTSEPERADTCLTPICRRTDVG